jgi:hypothetical protein
MGSLSKWVGLLATACLVAGCGGVEKTSVGSSGDAAAPREVAAGERRARLTIEVQIEGTERIDGNGSDHTSAQFREGYTLVTYLQTSGDLMQFNPKDPQYAQKMTSMAAAPPATDEPPRYLSYFGYDDCGAKAHVYVDRTTQGTFGDTTGAVPYTVKNTADYDSNADEVRIICNVHQAVLDTQNDTFYTDGAILPTAKGASSTTMRGKTTHSVGEAATHGEAYTWVVEQLRHVPRSGQRSTTVSLTQGQGAALHSGKYSGEARIQLAWKLEDL